MKIYCKRHGYIEKLEISTNPPTCWLCNEEDIENPMFGIVSCPSFEITYPYPSFKMPQSLKEKLHKTYWKLDNDLVDAFIQRIGNEEFTCLWKPI